MGYVLTGLAGMAQTDSSAAAVAAVVVTYRSAGAIVTCLESLLSVGGVGVVMVVDNSDDALTAHRCRSVSQRWPGRVCYLAPGANLGYSRGVNLGVARLAEAGEGRPWLLIANPDIELTGPVASLQDMATSTGAALVAGRLLTGGTGQAWNVRPQVTPARELARALVGHERTYEVRWLSGPGPTSVGQLDGALLLARWETFERLGGMDERFELYYEDVDLCHRARALGGCWVAHEPIGRHGGGASFLASPGPAYRALRVSRLRYLRKRWGPRGEALAVVVGLVETLARSLTRQSEGDPLRCQALVDLAMELARPGSVTVLES